MRDNRILRNRPVDRLWNVVLGCGGASDWSSDTATTFSPEHWQEITASGDLPEMIRELETAEFSTRLLRLQLESVASGSPARACATCGAAVHGRSDRRFCSEACRQTAHRQRS